MTDTLRLAIDIGGSKILAGIVDREGAIRDSERVGSCAGLAAAPLVDLVRGLADQLLQRNRAGIVESIGVAIPGLADPRSGQWIYSPFSGIRDLPIASMLTHEFGLPVAIENDVNACAVAERMFGCCRDVDDFVWITVSNGIGAGIFVRGELYRGSTLNAGEIGHVIVVDGGNLCGCGRRGCLEAHASGRAIASRYAELARGPWLDARQVAAAARDGDAAAARVYKEAGVHLGKAIAGAVNILNPARVVLGGGVAADLDLFLPALRGELEARVFREANRELRIERTALSGNAGLLGAAAVAQAAIRRSGS